MRQETSNELELEPAQCMTTGSAPHPSRLLSQRPSLEIGEQNLTDDAPGFFDVLETKAQQIPDHVAIAYLREDSTIQKQVTYQQLWERSCELGARFARKLSPGDRAVILAPTGIAYVSAFFGGIYAGIIPVPAYPPNSKRKDERIDTIVAASQASAVLASAETITRLSGSPAIADWPVNLDWIPLESSIEPIAGKAYPSQPSDIAFLQFTSGSTTSPRGVCVTHQNLLAQCEYISATVKPRKGDLNVSWLPLYHDMGLIGGLLSAIYMGVPTYLFPASEFMARPLRWLTAISRYGATISKGPNFAFDLCVDRISNAEAKNLDLSNWRLAFNGAEPIQASSLKRFLEKFAPVGFHSEAMRPCYGMAETTLMVSCSGEHSFRSIGVDPATLRDLRIELSEANDARQIVSCGPIGSDYRISVVNPETLEESPPGKIGEIWVQGSNVASGYWQATEETLYSFNAYLTNGQGPYLRTGDLGFLHEKELFITGRLKEVIIIRGANYFPRDIEAAAKSAHPLIQDVIAFGADEPERLVLIGELSRQALIQKPNYSQILISMRDAVGAALGLRLSELVLIKPLQLPRTSSGKVRRVACKLAWKRKGLPVVWQFSEEVKRARTRDNAEENKIVTGVEKNILQRLQTLVAKELSYSSADLVRTDCSLQSLGLDSLGIVSVKKALEHELEREIPLALLDDAPTLAEFAKRLEQLAGTIDTKNTERPQAAVQIGTAGAFDCDCQPRNWVAAPDLSLMFFSTDAAETEDDRYEFVQEASRIADTQGFAAVWIPERHFHRFGGLFPNPAVVGASIATITKRVRIRAGSVVLPLHDPIRVYEEWAVVDNLSHGRVDLAFATGWDADSFCLAPALYSDRVGKTLSAIQEVVDYWNGKPARRRNGRGDLVEVMPLPRPRQPSLNTWLTIAQDPRLFQEAGRRGLNVLTALLFQTAEALEQRIGLYREAREQAGMDPATGRVTVMLHTFIGQDISEVRRIVQEPLTRYLKTSVDLWRKESQPLAELSPEAREEVLHLAFERYFRTSGLFGTPAGGFDTISQFRSIGADEIACLIDFGVPTTTVLDSLTHLATLQRWIASGKPPASQTDFPADKHIQSAIPAAIRTTPVIATLQYSPTPTLRSAGFEQEHEHDLSDVALIEVSNEFSRPATSGAPYQPNAVQGIDLTARYRPLRAKSRDPFQRIAGFDLFNQIRDAGLMAFYKEFGARNGPYVEHQGRWLLQLGSLDYLGLTIDERVRRAAADAALEDGTSRTGSRLHNGTTKQQRDFERQLADFLGRQDALVFATGYQAQIGMLSGLLDPDSTAVLDEFAHASLYDGALIARCRITRFKHSDPNDLDRVLSSLSQTTPVLVIVESVYSNEGDLVPLPEIRAVCSAHGVRLALDEAHGLGVLGPTGRGAEEVFDMVGQIDILAGTFSKSLASIGGWIAGPADIIDWIRFHGRSILFSAAISPPALAAAAKSLEILASEPERVTKLQANAQFWKSELQKRDLPIGNPSGPTVPISLGDDSTCLAVARDLMANGIYVNAVLPPSVPIGKALLRTCVTAAHELHQLQEAAGTIAKVVKEYPRKPTFSHSE